jgi:asparagine N-glycosylation enzyme membrane subunit Stt3
MIRRGLRAFGHFWWDFLVGDTPEFFVVTLLVVGLAFLLRSERALGVVVLPVVVLGALALSTWRERQKKKSR